MTIPLIDSHCHLNQLDLTAFDNHLDKALDAARAIGVQHFLSVCITPDDIKALHALSASHADISMSVGVHPNEVAQHMLTYEKLYELSDSSHCIALGETGLDYFRTEAEADCASQRDSFRTHIRVARKLNKPLIIHTRAAAEDTLQIMKEEQADEVGGVMHCFSENWDIARRALDLNSIFHFQGL